ncbi:FAD-dependent oxidoreductase [Actinopolyspora mortivallis]|uniref:FAD-dependent oxidoreductase n=1 Tax=Actinopolyspora mortivallis TaxID=33906 RepID=UPI000381E6A0|nr:FAD-dependent oxidoreductase [Actinopolyspora mortivallis]
MRVLVVGNGPVAHRFVGALSARGHTDITVLGSSRGRNRALVPEVLAGKLSWSDTVLPPWPEGVRVRAGVSVVEVDRRRRLVRTDCGRVHRYDVLVLATGMRHDLTTVGGGVPSALLAGFAGGQRERSVPAVVLGGGVDGVRAAVALCSSGRRVNLVYRQHLPMAGRIGDGGGRHLESVLRERGVELWPHREAVGGDGRTVVLDDGERIDGVGLSCAPPVPNTALARAAGLRVGTGVVVDDRLRTSDPCVYAIGGCAEHVGCAVGDPVAGRRQAATLAAWLSGSERSYRGTPRVSRISTGGVDLTVLGPDAEGVSGEVETVFYRDAARGRYAELVLRDERLVRATMLGLPRGSAAVTQLFDGDRPVPRERLALLLGVPARGDGAVDAHGDNVVCDCNGVTEGQLELAWLEGARDVTALASRTRAGTGCGGCADEVRRLCALFTAPEESVWSVNSS